MFDLQKLTQTDDYISKEKDSLWYINYKAGSPTKNVRLALFLLAQSIQKAHLLKLCLDLRYKFSRCVLSVISPVFHGEGAVSHDSRNVS
jgi:hypothetical protein